MEPLDSLNYRMLAANQLAKSEYVEAINFCLKNFKALEIPTDRDMYQISSILVKAVINYYNLNITESNEIYIAFENRILKAISTIPFNNTENLLKLKMYTSQDYLEWGKYQGKKISEVLLLDFEYLLWCLINLDHFSIDPPFFIYFFLLTKKDLKKEIEFNLIKQLLYSNYLEEDSELETDDRSNYYYGYNSSDEFNFYEGYEGNNDAWDERNS
ncbi:exodeoxyribonuclease X C-terminal domain-containing protein [Mucilaginibacter terrae]|uniref:Exodeoxyribonuclease X-like C-terminal domain-containing protein n=1 Tax=Mucilaginibacter terrae TaxID=1955052 RepID=A0ABU3GV83_9SPHI|nr:hypothetical protein [Mucilaginibacter terrae]MDT3403570.1 hypothetical protein [Mucilaginibacter terrae]